MFKILTQIAWCVSVALGFIATFFAALAFDLIADGVALESEAFFFWIIFVVIFSMLSKRLFLSKQLIRKWTQDGARVEELKKPEIAITSVPSPMIEKLEVQPIRMSPPEVASQSFPVAEKMRVTEDIKEEPVPTKKKEPGFLQKFFRENALAKIGGILLFLAVLFLLQLVYAWIGPIGKLMIGFAVGFSVFAVGLLLEKKGFEKEARILMGISLLINYLVILSGRYLIGESMLDGRTVLNEAVTFFLLIANTIFAVSTAMAYNSSVLLFFSFIMAYANPFLIGQKGETEPNSLLFYALVVSLGAIALSVFYSKRSTYYSCNLLRAAFIGGNVLALFAPFESNFSWVLKLCAIGFLSLATIVTAYRNKDVELTRFYFIGTYIFLILLIIMGKASLGGDFSGYSISLSSLIFITLILLTSAAMIFLSSATALFASVLVVPLAIVLLLFGLEVFSILGLGFILVGTLLAYLLVFIFLSGKLSIGTRYLFFTALGLFVCCVGGYFNSVKSVYLSAYGVEGNGLKLQIYGIMSAAFIFLCTAYYYSCKKGTEFLYSIASVLSIVLLLSVIARDGSMKTASIVSVILFFLLNIGLPFINKQMFAKGVKNFLLGLIAGAVFLIGEVFYFWYGDMDQSKITIGFIFLILGIVYFLLGFFMKRRTEGMALSDLDHDGKISANAVYVFLGIAISVFSMAVAYIFSAHSDIISAIWIFEAVLMFFFYRKIKEEKIYLFGLAIGLFGLLKMLSLATQGMRGEYLSFIPLAIVFAAFAAGLKFLDFEKKNIRFGHDVFHVAGIGMILFLILKIVPDSNSGWEVLAFSAYVLLLSIVYGRIYCGWIKNVHLAFVSLIFCYHIFQLDSILYYLEKQKLGYWKIMQYLATIIFIFAASLYNYFLKIYKSLEQNSFHKLLFNSAVVLYVFIISSQYVYYAFNENAFVVTIYWGLISLALLGYGIEGNVLRFRTLGLYVLSLTTLKILLYDIWSGLDDAVMRVIALMVVGGIMIGVSVLYSRKYGSNLKGEFDFNNLK